jgi:cytochrome oxidase Cu insertion factor (SCO1/SenC/PrrC family)
VQLVGFLFPYCTTYCPLIARELARLQQALHAAGLDRRTQLVTFNVDPAHAGPRQLRAVMTEFGGDPSSGTWEYLTGSPAQVRAAVTGGFHVYYHRVSLAQERRIAAREKAAGTYTPQPEEPNRVAARAHVRYDVAHDDYLALVDPRGRIVAVLDQASTLTSEALLRDVRAVLAGAPVPGQPVG